MKEEHGLMVYEIRMLRQGSGINESNRRLHNKKLQRSYFSANIVVIKGDQIKKNEAGRTSKTHSTNKNRAHFQLENLKGRFHLQDPDIDLRI
jgi:hypothetical protein